jgi:gliding motility-associated lipoprotein GldD
MNRKHKSLFIFFAGLSVLAFSCCSGGDEFFAPKPRGYFRISFPEKSYQSIDTLYPFTFEIPVYAVLAHDTAGYSGEYWFNMFIPEYQGAIHFSYKTISDNLFEYTEDTRNFVYKHVPKAEDITVSEIKLDTARVFALSYFIEGAQAASPIQFYVTDSTKHFIRGALYFNHIPNNDSIQPVIDFIRTDIDHFIQTLKWK